MSPGVQAQPREHTYHLSQIQPNKISTKTNTKPAKLILHELRQAPPFLSRRAPSDDFPRAPFLLSLVEGTAGTGRNGTCLKWFFLEQDGQLGDTGPECEYT